MLGAAGRRVPHTPGCSSRRRPSAGLTAPGSQRSPAPPPGRPNDWPVLLPITGEGAALAPPPPRVDAGSGSAAARGGARRPERAHWAPRRPPGWGWGSAAEPLLLRGFWAPAGSEPPLEEAFGLQLELKAPEVYPCLQRAHVQFSFCGVGSLGEFGGGVYNLGLWPSEAIGDWERHTLVGTVFYPLVQTSEN